MHCKLGTFHDTGENKLKCVEHKASTMSFSFVAFSGCLFACESIQIRAFPIVPVFKVTGKEYTQLMNISDQPRNANTTYPGS